METFKSSLVLLKNFEEDSLSTDESCQGFFIFRMLKGSLIYGGSLKAFPPMEVVQKLFGAFMTFTKSPIHEIPSKRILAIEDA